MKICLCIWLTCTGIASLLLLFGNQFEGHWKTASVVLGHGIPATLYFQAMLYMIFKTWEEEKSQEDCSDPSDNTNDASPCSGMKNDCPTAIQPGSPKPDKSLELN